VNVQYAALPLLSATFFDGVIISDFGTVLVCGYCEASALELIRDVRREERSDGACLIEYFQRFSVNLDDASNGCWTFKSLAIVARYA